jgi:hypothetical protein
MSRLGCALWGNFQNKKVNSLFQKKLVAHFTFPQIEITAGKVS